jgi:hypothetical protein
MRMKLGAVLAAPAKLTPREQKINKKVNGENEDSIF